MSSEHEQRLTACNRKLVEELNHAGKRLAIAERGMQLLEKASSADWNEAEEVLRAWKAARQGGKQADPR